MKRLFFLISIVIFTLGVYTHTANAVGKLPPSTSTTWANPIRTFVFDTLGNPVNAMLRVENNGELREVSNGQVIKTWKIKYEKKGHARGVCDPPVMNVSFDKIDKKKDGREILRELFTGRSTFAGNSTYSAKSSLQYQKVRFVALCDPVHYYSSSSGNGGFDGKIDPHLREYTALGILRALDVPTVDVIGLADVSFISPDTQYNGQIYRYMLLQRDNEKDDEIAFVDQFGLDPDLIEDGGQFQSIYGKSNRLEEVSVKNVALDQEITANLDPESVIRASLLEAFVGDSDRGLLHNEDYAKIRGTDKWTVIPYGFDWDFYSCIPSNDRNYVAYNYVTSDINQLPAQKQTEYKAKYYRIARDIFSNYTSLEKMLQVVDRYPVAGNKELLKQYLKLNFYNYGVYFSSREFAEYSDMPYNPFTPYPFQSEEEYTIAFRIFDKVCRNYTLTEAPDAEVKVHSAILERLEYVRDDILPGRNEGMLRATFRISITAPSNKEVLVRKQGAFSAELNTVNTESKDSINSPQGLWISYEKPTILAQSAGPNYIIPSGQTVEFIVTATQAEDEIEGGNYTAHLNNGISGGVGLANITIPSHKTNTLNIVGMQRPKIISISNGSVDSTIHIEGRRFDPKTNTFIFHKSESNLEKKIILPALSSELIEFIPAEYGLSSGDYWLSIEWNGRPYWQNLDILRLSSTVESSPAFSDDTTIQPMINSLSRQSGTVGAVISIIGTGFNKPPREFNKSPRAFNNRVKFESKTGIGVITVGNLPASNDGTNISFVIPSQLYKTLGDNSGKINTARGVYKISILASGSSNTWSNEVEFTVSGRASLAGFIQGLFTPQESTSQTFLQKLFSPRPQPVTSPLPIDNNTKNNVPVVSNAPSITNVTPAVVPNRILTTSRQNSTAEGNGCQNPPKMITVGGIGSTDSHPIFSFMENIAPGSIKIPLRPNSPARNSLILQEEINKQLLTGHRVLVNAHSLGAAIAFDIRDRFQGKCVEFMYIDPPYNNFWSKLPNASLFSGGAALIRRAFERGIATDPDLINWTDGKGSGKEHDPWSYYNYGNNKQKLEALRRAIENRLQGNCNGNCSSRATSLNISLKPPPRITKTLSSNLSSGLVSPGEKITISGSGFSSTGNSVELQNSSNPNIYYDILLYESLDLTNNQ
ncbi:MAG TPA: hypothetical protein VJJ28_01110, partial [Candidatus Paceibacterota bacterium]